MIAQLGKIPEEVLTAVTTELRENYNFTTETTQPIQIPKELLNAIRQQYPAPVVLKFLSQRFHGRVLGITNEDLYAEDLHFVFGQAYCPGSIALISILRLDPVFYKQKSDEKLLIERAVKEAVHEVGHMFGLRHCTIMTCVMAFSNTVGDVDSKRRNMCDSCRRQSPF